MQIAVSDDFRGVFGDRFPGLPIVNAQRCTPESVRDAARECYADDLIRGRKTVTDTPEGCRVEWYGHVTGPQCTEWRA